MMEIAPAIKHSIITGEAKAGGPYVVKKGKAYIRYDEIEVSFDELGVVVTLRYQNVRVGWVRSGKLLNASTDTLSITGLKGKTPVVVG